jgi:uncharacterized membrane protein
MLPVLVVVVGLVSIFTPAQVSAQDPSGDDQPVVFVVILYSTTCPHCQNLIANDWPPIAEEFGDLLRPVWINISSQYGNQLGGAVYDYYNIPPDQRFVPMMFLGDQVFVGGNEIPNEGREAIREAIANGGMALPPVPGLQEAYNQAMAAEQTESGSGSTEGSEAAPTNPATAEEPDPLAAPTASEPELAGSSSLISRLQRDLAGNMLAIVVLAGLVLSFGAVIVTGTRTHRRALDWLESRTAVAAALITALVSTGVAITLLAEAADSPLSLVMAGLAAAAFLASAVLLLLKILHSEGALPSWLAVLAILAGLAAAIYLAYVEVGQETAVCGAIGDCNTVQQSEYATLFGVIPIGVLGVAGYVAMLAVWLVTLFAGKELADWARVGLFIMALFGVVFSAYLTFLEPFIIGATCAWCLTSALSMLLLLWLTAGPGLRTLRRVMA